MVGRHSRHSRHDRHSRYSRHDRHSRHSRHDRHSTGEREEGSGDGGAEAAEEEALGDEEVLGVGRAEERGEVQSGVDVRERAKGQEVVGDDGAA